MLASCTSTPATSDASKLLGTWVSEKNGCKEVYTFLPNGVRTYSSGNEVGEARYTVKAVTPFVFQCTDVITKTNNGTDCDGAPGAQKGDKANIFIRLTSDNSQMTLCADAAGDRCSEWVFTKQ